MGLPAYQCSVRLHGELGQTVPMDGISAAHVIMLMSEHGEENVVDIKPTVKKSRHVIEETLDENGKRISRPRKMKEEKAFLVDKFGEEKVRATFGGHYKAALPETLDLDGVDDEEEDEKPRKRLSPAASKGKGKAKPAPEEETDSEEEEEDDTNSTDTGGL